MQWNHEFEEIVKNIDIDVDTGGMNLELGEANRAVMGMTEAATFLSKLVGSAMHDESLLQDLDQELVGAIRESIMLTDYIAAMLTGCDCPNCSPCECSDLTDDDDLCDACRAIYDYDDDDDEL